jgi:hypothetical protein
MYNLNLLGTKFEIFFRDFRLILTPKKGLLHHQFEATSIDAEGNETPIAVGMFYT